MSGGYKQCTRCVMDTTTALIVFDEKGVCNFCHDYDKHAAESVLRDRAIRYAEFDQLISRDQTSGKRKGERLYF
ncbi:MAG: hypothetical protein IPJ60_12885 [Sphingobacteriaceae bacterium]|nr:hypothetical protein [Sphingobacteriaceae bacterium]